MDIINEYRASMFDGQADVAWLHQGWRGLRLYGRRARLAIAAGDVATKAIMLARADDLLTLMSGILDTSDASTLGQALMTIYSALRYTLLRANTENSLSALDDFEAALAILDQDMAKVSEGALVA
ncbi:flagellar protein FliS [Acidocella sp. KAb 2-4]|uniref:flagellar protein FliS n=1 Tax=Acidocella sp. KAb 2-4 TaxID=2885158 RepID=UPI001D091668|nr:flagellar protein FliS [Acidocella sp. KAb 2-4]MCB5945702.1 flagellar protein FliS [Acidocella sp. KAb 2-4]